jgi:DNA-binding IclR family transcriptional regulator
MPIGKNDPPRNGYKAPAVHKAFQLIRAVADAQDGVRLADLAARVGFSLSTTHGLVHALLRENVLIQGEDPHKLFLGPLIANLAFTDWNYIKASRLGQPIINEVRDGVMDATVFLGVRVRNRVAITASAEAIESFKISAPVGTTIPLFAGAAGKVLLSLEDDECVKQLAGERGLPHFTPNSIVDMEDFLAELNRVRSRGYAIDDEEYMSGVRAVAAPVNNCRGLPMAIWVVGIVGNMGLARLYHLADTVVNAAGKLRSQLEGIGRSASGSLAQ